MKINCEKISKSFENDTEDKKNNIIKDLSFTLDSSDSLAVFGPSGVGKSTLINILTGLDNPDKGDIFYDDVCFTKMNYSDKTKFRLKNISIIFQNFNLLNDFNVLENITLPLRYQGSNKKNSNQIAYEVLEKLNLESKYNARIDTLSGGEAQRVSIARALAMKPKIIFADEPTGNLDTNSSNIVISEIMKICDREKITLVIVSHDSGVLKKISHKKEMKDGVFI